MIGYSCGPRSASSAGVLRIAFCLMVFLLCGGFSAGAQTTDRLAAGVAVTSVNPAAEDLRSATKVGIVIGRGRTPGWGITGALNWFDSDVLGGFAGVEGPVGTLRVRPLLGGISYTVLRGRVAASGSFVAGPAFNRLRLNDEVRDRLRPVAGELDEDLRSVTLALRPGVSLAFSLTPRVALTGFGGYLFNQPRFTLPTSAGEVRNRWNANAVVLSTGVMVAVF